MRLLFEIEEKETDVTKFLNAEEIEQIIKIVELAYERKNKKEREKK